MNGDLFGFGLSMDDLDGIEVQESSEAEYDVIPLTFTSRDGSKNETIYITEDVDTALLFNADLDVFSSYSMFTLPEGKEVKNEVILNKFARGEMCRISESAIKESLKDTFDNRFLRAMLEN